MDLCYLLDLFFVDVFFVFFFLLSFLLAVDVYEEDPAAQRASEEATRVINEQRQEIGTLKSYLKKLESHLVAKRPISREQLPPIDGIHLG